MSRFATTCINTAGNGTHPHAFTHQAFRDSQVPDAMRVTTMLLVWLGALLIISGIVLTAIRTLQRGRLSDTRMPPASDHPDTLEPKDSGRRLSLKAELPGLMLVVLGSVLLLTAAL